VRVEGLDHVGLACADLDRTVAFFAEVLGIPVRSRGELDGHAGAAVGVPDLRGRFADLDLGADRTLELFEIHRPPGARVENDPLRPGGTHIALSVTGITELATRARAAGYTTRSPEPIELSEPGFWHGLRTIYIDGPEDLCVELVERRAS
jgi:catechol 2,3-dioxygenase-like lactoylglutathione lyase family enzyme